MQGDMTMAVDVAMRHFQAFWPWAAEFGLLDAVLAIFMPTEKAAEGQPAPQLQPWMYVNIVLEHAQALVPVSRDLLDVDAAVKTCRSEQESLGTGSRSLLNLASRIAKTSGAFARVSKQVMQQPRMFQLMAQVPRMPLRVAACLSAKTCCLPIRLLGFGLKCGALSAGNAEQAG